MVLKRLIDDRATIDVTDSSLESEILTLIRAAGLPLPMLQYVVETEGRFVARLDFAYPHDLVAVEADGFRHHDQRSTFDGERARGNDLEAHGWRVLRVTAQHLENPSGVVDWIRRALHL